VIAVGTGVRRYDDARHPDEIAVGTGVRRYDDARHPDEIAVGTGVRRYDDVRHPGESRGPRPGGRPLRDVPARIYANVTPPSRINTP